MGRGISSSGRQVANQKCPNHPLIRPDEFWPLPLATGIYFGSYKIFFPEKRKSKLRTLLIWFSLSDVKHVIRNIMLRSSTHFFLFGYTACLGEFASTLDNLHSSSHNLFTRLHMG